MSSIHKVMRDELETKLVFEMAKTYSFNYIDQIDKRPVYPHETSLDILKVFDEPLPNDPLSGEQVLNLLHKYGSPNTVSQTGGRYFGFVNGSVTPTGLAARWLADTWNQNSAMFVMSPIAAKLEEVTEKWLISLFGLPENSAMGLVEGTSTATKVGLITARNAILDQLGWNVNTQGLFGAPELRVVMSEEAHSSVDKALALIGMGNKRVERVRSDDEGRMEPSDLPKLDERTILILQAGNVNTGAFDDFQQICRIAKEAGSWIHIDGAFGLWASVSSKKYLTKGIELADSWSVDAHKTLNSPYDCGIVLCRDRDKLIAAMEATGDYLEYSKNRDGMQYVPGMSRRSRSVELWSTIKHLGRKGIMEIVDQFCDFAQLIAQELEEAGFNIINDVVFNQVLVAMDTEEETAQLLELLQQSGIIWLGGSTFKKQKVIRISICSWQTTRKDINQSVHAFIEARNRMKSY